MDGDLFSFSFLIMSDPLKTESQRATWLRKYYLVRAAFSFAWVAAVFTVAKQSPALATVLLIVYPAWDAFANLLDVRMTGGAKANATQLLNIWISALVTLAVAGSLVFKLQIALAIFGIWAIVAGLLQLATAIRRRKDNGGQWVMMLSGAQSALAGGFFVAQQGSGAPVLQTIVGYAAVGAVYFLISGVMVLVRESRRGARGLASGGG
ncbi:hypothetical protein GGD71_005479 [Variovorax guangxiensis]|uniref:DUF308 domain-containing protein n=2 Tax=Variovorax guangxiensis TaxID=1775474 RepID=A0A840FRM9_9BURK|nr:hypothetical protein [Variovorax guangxiensis]